VAFHTNGRPRPIARALDLHYYPNVTRTSYPVEEEVA
jgi:hypothetical protein